MKKTGDAEKLEVLRGREAQVLHSHMQRTGRYSVADFTEDEMKLLKFELKQARDQDERDEKEAKDRAKLAEKAAKDSDEEEKSE